MVMVDFRNIPVTYIIYPWAVERPIELQIYFVLLINIMEANKIVTLFTRNYPSRTLNSDYNEYTV